MTTPAGNNIPDRATARVLLVDDDQKLMFVLRAHMRRAGYETLVCHSAEDALAAIGDFKPDVVVMDHGLPGMDGIEAIRLIMSNPDTSDVAIIMVTARSDSESVVLALELGAQEYVVKPFDISELLARVQSAYRLREAQLQLNRLNGKLSQTVEQRTRRLRILYNFTRDINEADCKDAILDLIVDAVKKVTGCNRVSILLKEQDESVLACAKSLGISESIAAGIRVASGEGIAGKVYESGRTYIASTINSNGSDENYESDAFVSTPLIATSLMTHQEKLGVLSITDKGDREPFSPDEIECIRSIADSGAIALNNQIHYERLHNSVNALLLTVGQLAEYRDNETSHHLQRVRQYARILAGKMQESPRYRGIITDEYVSNLYRAAPMHDIGKVGVADYILCKPGKLTDEEFDLMKEHCRIGRDVLQSAMNQTGPVPILQMCVDIAYCHHEKFNGKGYPRGIEDEEIPLSARIITLVDAYDAITSQRRYKDAIPHERAVEIVRSESGKHFDPDIVEHFLRCADRFDEIREKYVDDWSNEPEENHTVIARV